MGLIHRRWFDADLFTAALAVVSASSPCRVGGIVWLVSEDRVDLNPVGDTEDIWTRNERIRTAELRADSARPMGELLEAGVELSRFASELAVSAHTAVRDGGVRAGAAP